MGRLTVGGVGVRTVIVGVRTVGVAMRTVGGAMRTVGVGARTVGARARAAGITGGDAAVPSEAVGARLDEVPVMVLPLVLPCLPACGIVNDGAFDCGGAPRLEDFTGDRMAEVD